MDRPSNFRRVLSDIPLNIPFIQQLPMRNTHRVRFPYIGSVCGDKRPRQADFAGARASEHVKKPGISIFGENS
jgi:hypothetical protein